MHKTDIPTSLSRGLHTIACIEALKGALVLVVGFGLLSLVDQDLQAAAERIVRFSHLNPARHYPQVFIQALANTTDARLKFLAALAFLYSGARFVEAYGLWRMKAWAEWFAIISGAIYLPVEIVGLIKRATFLKAGVFLVNAGIVGYLVYALWLSKKVKAKSECDSSAGV